jgi:hypothetical protein
MKGAEGNASVALQTVVDLRRVMDCQARQVELEEREGRREELGSPQSNKHCMLRRRDKRLREDQATLSRARRLLESTFSNLFKPQPLQRLPTSEHCVGLDESHEALIGDKKAAEPLAPSYYSVLR